MQRPSCNITLQWCQTKKDFSASNKEMILHTVIHPLAGASYSHYKPHKNIPLWKTTGTYSTFKIVQYWWDMAAHIFNSSTW